MTGQSSIGESPTGTAQAGTTHETLVAGQFGPQAAAYLASAAHAGGEDLALLAALARRHPGAEALDLGCGGGHVTYAIAPHVRRVVACDLSEQMLGVVAAEAAGRGLANVETRAAAAEALPFPDGGFDLVVSRFSAHHWRDVEAGLREIRRVLRPGGTAAIADAVSPGPPLLDTFLQAIELLRDPSHVRDYARAEWEAMAARAGFLPGTVTGRRLRLDFASWVTRMRTPEAQVRAIRALQGAVSEPVRRHFAIGPDGSFDLDTMVMELG